MNYRAEFHITFFTRISRASKLRAAEIGAESAEGLIDARKSCEAIRGASALTIVGYLWTLTRA
jgi:hypothetical protein